MTLHTPDTRIAIIGAGPSGLVTARWLLEAGLTPVIFEAASALGGHWNSAGPHSATWPGMRTNTSRVMSAFSDLDHAPGTAVYPRQDQMLDYLHAYAGRFGLMPHLRLASPVVSMTQAEGGWLLRSTCGGVESVEHFGRVIIASGRHSKPVVPQVLGLDSFSGFLGSAHTAAYAGPARFAGASVLVAGCSISALEIATDLALGGAASVTVAMRKQRYVLPKLIAGVPTDHVMFNRAAALAGEILPPEALAAGLKSAVLGASGHPAQFGAAAPDDNIFAAGISQSQGFLPAVAEGRITTRPWIDRIEGSRVHFTDGHSATFDAVLFGTGFRRDLPWLAPAVTKALALDVPVADLYAESFHPDHDGLAFVGMYDLVGPYLPVLELQARWVAQVFAGSAVLPTTTEQRAAILAARAAPPALPMHALAVQFARLAGVEPTVARWPDLERALLFGPLSPASFRLEGPAALPDAAQRSVDAAGAFGRIIRPDYDPDEQGLRNLVLGSQAAAA
ncbi:MAG: NAD(P)-binding domain-containing protein [bacterium]